MRTEELEYDLPPGRIATRPVEPRDSARLLVMWQSDAARPIEHRHVRDLPEYLHVGDALVFNTTAVAPARFMGRRARTVGHIEGLFIEELPAQAITPTWRVMLKSGGHLKPGERINLVDRQQHLADSAIELLEQDGAEWLALLHADQPTAEVLNRLGWTPLPPYILKARRQQRFDDLDDRRWYQTVYADGTQKRSIAAPTAGLHFTQELLSRIHAMQVQRIDVTLHVGPGTFKPVTAPTLELHRMHSERFEISAAALNALGQVRQRSGTGGSSRIIAIGTTAVRSLESLPSNALEQPTTTPFADQTNLLIAPPYEFKVVDGLLTNFHLPRSTLLALVAAMIGLDRMKMVYDEAIQREYRFYSYGDAMLILP